MVDEWPEVPLSSIAIKIGSGATPRGGGEAYLKAREEFSLVRSQNVFDRRFDDSGLAFISKSQANELRNVALQEGDILLNITGDGITFARACIVPGRILPACVNQHVAIIRVNRELAEPGYVLAFLTASRTKVYMESFNAGGSRRALTKGHIESFQIPLPPLREQQAIAKILGALDDKIELNRKMNETLEAMARALFQSWFVDFDPVRAKAEGRDPGLPPHLADLFPSSLVDSEIGEIPNGWSSSCLQDLIDLNPRTPVEKGALIAYLDMANVPSRGYAVDKVVSRVVGSGSRFVNGDTLLARITPCLENGKTAFVDFLRDGEAGWGSTEFIVLRALDLVPPEYVYCLARDSSFREFSIQSMTGSSGRQRVSTDALKTYPLARARKEIYQLFGETVGPLFQRATQVSTESRTLTELRDTLLPKLISGELRVKDAERTVEGVV